MHENRLIFFHKQNTSARLRFLKFANGSVCAFEPLPALSQILDSSIDPDAENNIVEHPAQLLPDAGAQLGLDPVERLSGQRRERPAARLREERRADQHEGRQKQELQQRLKLPVATPHEPDALTFTAIDDIDSGVVKFDWLFDVVDTRQELKVDLFYNTALFDPDVVAAVLRDVLAAADRIASGGDDHGVQVFPFQHPAVIVRAFFAESRWLRLAGCFHQVLPPLEVGPDGLDRRTDGPPVVDHELRASRIWKEHQLHPLEANELAGAVARGCRLGDDMGIVVAIPPAYEKKLNALVSLFSHKRENS